MRGYVNHFRPNNFGTFDHIRRYTQYDIERRYLTGECWHFAQALHHLFGWPLIIISFWPLLKKGECMHALAQADDSWFVDVEGPCTLSELAEQFGDPLYIHRVTPQHFGKSVSGCCRYSEQYARRHIQRNLQHYLAAPEQSTPE